MRTLNKNTLCRMEQYIHEFQTENGRSPSYRNIMHAMGMSSLNLVQRYVQIIQSILFNQTMIVMIAACAVGIIVVYLIRRLSMDYAWIVAIVAGSVAELLVMFVGDFIFLNSIGRTDLPTGNDMEMQKSLELISKYPDDIVVYPGHGETTTLGYEKENFKYYY